MIDVTAIAAIMIRQPLLCNEEIPETAGTTIIVSANVASRCFET
jgi:hypothetical protein